MYNLVKSEFFKLKHNPIFLYAPCLMVISIIGNIIDSIHYINIALEAGWQSYEGVTCFINNLYVDNSILILNIILATIFICYDFDHRIIQAQISSGCNKLKMLLSKVIVTFIAITIFTALYTFIYTIIISIYNNFGTHFTFIMFKRMILDYIFSLLIHTGLLSFVVTFSYLFKKSGLAVAANAFSFIVITFVLDKISTKLTLVNKFMDFIIFNHDLTLNLTQNEIFTAILASLTSILINLFISYCIFKHSELK